MKRTLLVALSWSFCVGVVGLIQAEAAESQRPNILFIYADDFGWRDASFMGSDFFETPQLDQLASEGLVFTDAYSCAANCAPARACLMSGQYTPRHQIFNVGTGPRGKAAYRRLLHVPGTNVLDPERKTWAQQLQSAGYRTAIMGKWHLSADPRPYGFDINIGGTQSGSPPNGYYAPHTYRGQPVPGLELAPANEYLTDRLADEAIRFIETSADQPWLVYLSHFAVHTPLQANKRWLEKYKAKPAGMMHHHVEMATMIQSVDDGVGRIMQTLRKLSLDENTIIIFYSDNGGVNWATDMEPLRGYKGTFYEGGIRVPCFVRWPSGLKRRGTTSEPIIGVDWFPTLCELAGAELPSDQKLDGINLASWLTTDSGQLPNRDLFWHFPAYLESQGKRGREQRDPVFRTRPCSVIRSGKWKLHEYFEGGDLELYDLERDICEQHNLAETEPERAQELLRRLEAWEVKLNAPVPLEWNPEFDARKEQEAIEALAAGD